MTDGASGTIVELGRLWEDFRVQQRISLPVPAC
jgi:hypothetical protein